MRRDLDRNTRQRHVAVRLLQIDCKRPRRRDLPALGQMQRSMEPLLTQQLVFKGQREFLRDVLCNIRRFVVIHIHIERMRSVLHQERVCKGASIVPCVPAAYALRFIALTAFIRQNCLDPKIIVEGQILRVHKALHLNCNALHQLVDRIGN